MILLTNTPFSLHPPDAQEACLLIHGLGGGPREMNPLAEHLAGLGIAVETLCLPGHEPTIDRKMPISYWKDWVTATQQHYERLFERYPGRVYLIGLSNGAIVALRVAWQNRLDKPVNKLVLLAPFFKIAPRKILNQRISIDPWVPLLEPWMQDIPRGPEGVFDMDVQQALQATRAVDTFNLATLQQALQLIEAVKNQLPDISTPTLMINSLQDGVVCPMAAQKAFEQLGSAQKQCLQVAQSNHIITLDHDRALVEAAITDFLSRVP